MDNNEIRRENLVRMMSTLLADITMYHLQLSEANGFKYTIKVATQYEQWLVNAIEDIKTVEYVSVWGSCKPHIDKLKEIERFCSTLETAVFLATLKLELK